jgi:hypothetical protein
MDENNWREAICFSVISYQLSVISYHRAWHWGCIVGMLQFQGLARGISPTKINGM